MDGAVSSPSKGEREREGNIPPAQLEQLQDRRVTALKKRRRDTVQSREESTSIDTSTEARPPIANATHGLSGVSSQGSLDLTNGEYFLSPAVDLERAKAIYCPVIGPVRMQTCWLPANLTVSQMENSEPAVDPAKVKLVMTTDEPICSAGSVTVDMVDQVSDSNPEVIRGVVPMAMDVTSRRHPGVVQCGEAQVEQEVATVGPSLKTNKFDNCQDIPIIIESYGGYRSAIGTHGCHQGTYVYEVQVQCDVSERKGFGIRLGWATKHHELERILHQPVAAIHGDGYGFNVVNTSHEEGSVFYSLHKGAKQELPVSRSARNVVKTGDIFGVVIHLGDKGREFEIKQDDLVRYKKTGRDHIKLPGPDWMDERKSQPGSYMELFWNGESQGRAFQDSILESTYYPMVSLYTCLESLPGGETDPGQRARVQVMFDFGAIVHSYPEGVNCLENKSNRGH
jgi:hypothetical protein